VTQDEASICDDEGFEGFEGLDNLRNAFFALDCLDFAMIVIATLVTVFVEERWDLRRPGERNPSA
jgi:hypothetical protein